MTHTPGPWAKYGEFPNKVFIQPPKDSANLVNIAVVNAGRDEYQANARLIAAAPDLLEALEAIVGDINELGRYESPPDNYAEVEWEYIDKARAAIAKAREPS